MPQSGTISVALCSYNGGKYIGRQLQSIAAQTRLPSELVIYDDCSTDSTAEIVQSFARSATFPVRFIANTENQGAIKKGITRNFEKASRLCTGTLIAFCDQDDEWFPEKLARMAAVMDQNPQNGGVFSDAQLIDSQSTPTGATLWQTNGFDKASQSKMLQGESLSVLLSMTKVYGCTLMIDARLLDKILPVPPSWWFDAWLACMVAVQSKLAFVPEPLLSYRIHPSQQVGAKVLSLSERLRRWRLSPKQYRDEIYPQLTELYERLRSQDSPATANQLQYVRGRLDLIELRSSLPSNRLLRLTKVLQNRRKYHLYFNGWKSILKDLTA